MSKRYNRVIIQNSEIFNSKLVGIYLQGVNSEPNIIRCMINNIEGPGVKIQRGSKAKIQLCEFVECKVGIQAISADPIINMNKIRRNLESGIHIIAKNGLRSDAILKYNWVEKNLGDGIFLEGDQNYTRVEKNHHIDSNRKSGIKASNFASPKIVNNMVFSNFGQGVLLVDSASAYIEKNEIF